jgi:hypothetical protein
LGVADVFLDPVVVSKRIQSSISQALKRAPLQSKKNEWERRTYRASRILRLRLLEVVKHISHVAATIPGGGMRGGDIRRE